MPLYQRGSGMPKYREYLSSAMIRLALMLAILLVCHAFVAAGDGKTKAEAILRELRSAPPIEPAGFGDSFWKELFDIRGKRIPDTLLELQNDDYTELSSHVTISLWKGDMHFDFKVCYAFEEYLFNFGGFGEDEGLYFGSDDRNVRLRAAQRSFARAIRERIISDRAALRSSQHFLAWRSRWLNGWDFSRLGAKSFLLKAERIHKAISDGSKDYDCHLRDFIVIAYTTGRSDLIPAQDASQDKVLESVRSWCEWFDANGCFLRPSLTQQTWSLDTALRDAKIGHAPFFEDRSLCKPEYFPQSPFPGWPFGDVPKKGGLY